MRLPCNQQGRLQLTYRNCFAARRLRWCTRGWRYRTASRSHPTRCRGAGGCMRMRGWRLHSTQPPRTSSLLLAMRHAPASLQASEQPQVEIGGGLSQSALKGKMFTLLMLDPDAPSPDSPTNRSW